MLLLKKKIIFLNFRKKSIKIFIFFSLIYYFVIQKITILLYFSNCSLQRYYLVSNSLKYFYNLKWNSFASYTLQIKINSLLEFFIYFMSIISSKKIWNFSNSEYFVSVIRSPFVYKKSMEQFFHETYKICCITNIFKYDFFFQGYQFYFLKNELKENSIFKFFCKITFLFK